MSDTKNAIAAAPAPIATPKSASWANWVIRVQGPLLGLILAQLKTVVDYTAASMFIVEGEQVRVLDYRGPTLYAGQGCYLKLAN